MTTAYISAAKLRRWITMRLDIGSGLAREAALRDVLAEVDRLAEQPRTLPANMDSLRKFLGDMLDAYAGTELLPPAALDSLRAQLDQLDRLATPVNGGPTVIAHIPPMASREPAFMGGTRDVWPAGVSVLSDGQMHIVGLGHLSPQMAQMLMVSLAAATAHAHRIRNPTTPETTNAD